MRSWITIGVVALALLGLAAGIPKVLQSPQETEFFQAAGVPLIILMPFGLLQVVSAGLALWPRTRRIGLILTGLCFVGSAAMIYATDNVIFSSIAMLAGALALIIAAKIPQSGP